MTIFLYSAIPSSPMETFRDAIAYPFGRFSRLFYWLWILVPIVGALAFVGYEVRMIRTLLKGNRKEAPAFGPFWENAKVGLFFLVFALLYSLLLGLISIIPFIGKLLYIIGFFIIPVLMVQCATGAGFTHMLKQGFRIDRGADLIFKHIGMYLLTVLKIIAVVVLAVIASLPLITLIITYPAYRYAFWYLVTGFWRAAQRK